MINKLLDKFNIKQVAAIILYSRSITSKWEVTCVLLLLSSDFFVQLYSACTAATIETAKRVGKRKKMSIPFLSPSRKSIKINCRSIKKHVSILGTQVSIIKNTLGRFKIIIKDVVQEMIKYAIKNTSDYIFLIVIIFKY